MKTAVEKIAPAMKTGLATPPGTSWFPGQKHPNPIYAGGATLRE